jgi:hypothetical protein
VPPDDVDVLRERVRVLAAGLGVDESFEMPAEVRALVAGGEKVRAVRQLRRAHRQLSLVATKRMVDALGD